MPGPQKNKSRANKGVKSNLKSNLSDSGCQKKEKKRVKKIRRELTNFKLMYSNINHLKSKMESLKSILEQTKPSVSALVETKIAVKEEMEMEGYTPYPMNRNEHGGGILLLVKKELKNLVVVVQEQVEVGEVMWITLSNNRNNIRIGVVYVPQEKDVKVDELKLMYKSIKEQVEEAKAKKEKVLIVGDFNGKVGITVPGNTEERK